MRKVHIIYIFALMASLFTMASCSESEGTEEEFANWKTKNETQFDQIYSEAKAKADAGDNTWKVIRGFQFESTAPAHDYNNIVVHVLTEGKGSGCPLYTDSVRVNLRGQLMPSLSYSGGYTFLTTYPGDFDPATAATGKYPVLTSTYITDGLSTALQNMHIGDRWMVYVPYQLGYGTTDQSTNVVVPAYSMLIYDVRLVGYYRAGTNVPDAHAQAAGEWVEE